METENIIYSIEESSEAWIWGIKPNEIGQVIVPDSIVENGISYPVTFINFGKNGKVRELVKATELHLPHSIKRFSINNPFIHSIHYHGDLDELRGISKFCTSLERFIVHGTLKKIGYGAFKDVGSLIEIIVQEESSIEINCLAFRNCFNLEQIIVNGKPIEFEFCPNTNCPSAFCGCKSFRFIGDNIKVVDGMLLSADGTILYTIVGRHNDDGHYIIPETVSDTYHGMSYSNLRIIDFSKSQVSVIYNDTFKGCNTLEKVILPNHKIDVGDRAFYECVNLTEVVNFGYIFQFGIASFAHSGIKECRLSSMVEALPKSVFRDCKNLRKLIIPNSVKSINNTAFEDCINLQNVIIPQGFEYAIKDIFNKCEDINITIDRPIRNHSGYRRIGAYTHGSLNCPYCGSSNFRSYCDGTAECLDCGGEYTYWR